MKYAIRRAPAGKDPPRYLRECYHDPGCPDGMWDTADVAATFSTVEEARARLAKRSRLYDGEVAEIVSLEFGLKWSVGPGDTRPYLTVDANGWQGWDAREQAARFDSREGVRTYRRLNLPGLRREKNVRIVRFVRKVS